MPLIPLARRAAGLALLALTAHGTLAQTVVHSFRGGESDSGAAHGGSLNSTAIDTAGTTNLTRIDSGGTYSNVTNGGISTLSYSLDGSQSYRGSANTALTSGASFAMEVWFRPASVSGTQVLFYNGNTSGSGIGLFLSNTGLNILRGGDSVNVFTGTIATNTWYHAAVVWDNGTVSGYLNGSSNVNPASATMNAPSGSLILGSNNLDGERFNGLIDEARIFTFTSGTFTPSMLNYSAVPEPSTYAALAGLAVLGAAFWYRRRRAG